MRTIYPHSGLPYHWLENDRLRPQNGIMNLVSFICTFIVYLPSELIEIEESMDDEDVSNR